MAIREPRAKPWTAAEERELLHRRERGETFRSIGRVLKRGQSGVASKYRELKYRAQQDKERMREQSKQARLNQAPAGSMGTCKGLHYKQDVFGRIFYHSGDEWKLSTLKRSEINWSL